MPKIPVTTRCLTRTKEGTSSRKRGPSHKKLGNSCLFEAERRRPQNCGSLDKRDSHSHPAAASETALVPSVNSQRSELITAPETVQAFIKNYYFAWML